MTPIIPPNAARIDAQAAPDDRARDQLELELLTLEAQLKGYAKKEASQRYIIKWVAVAIGILVILSMLTILGHALHRLHWWPLLRPSPAFMVVIVAAPVASITTITIAFFIGAFRKFDDKDADRAANGVATGLNVYRGG